MRKEREKEKRVGREGRKREMFTFSAWEVEVVGWTGGGWRKGEKEVEVRWQTM